MLFDACESLFIEAVRALSEALRVLVESVRLRELLDAYERA
jgi:hypothetical protein